MFYQKPQSLIHPPRDGIPCSWCKSITRRRGCCFTPKTSPALLSIFPSERSLCAPVSGRWRTPSHTHLPRESRWQKQKARMWLPSSEIWFTFSYFLGVCSLYVAARQTLVLPGLRLGPRARVVSTALARQKMEQVKKNGSHVQQFPS